MPTNNKDWAGNVERLFKVKQRRDVQGGGAWYHIFGEPTINMGDVFNIYKDHMINTYIINADKLIDVSKRDYYYKAIYKKINVTGPVRDNITKSVIINVIRDQLNADFKIPDKKTTTTWIDLFTNFSTMFIDIYNLYINTQSTHTSPLNGGVCEYSGALKLNKDCTIAVVNGFVNQFCKKLEINVNQEWLLSEDTQFDITSITTHIIKFIKDILVVNHKNNPHISEGFALLIKNLEQQPINEPPQATKFGEPLPPFVTPSPEVLEELRRQEKDRIITPVEEKQKKIASFQQPTRTAPPSLLEKEAAITDTQRIQEEIRKTEEAKLKAAKQEADEDTAALEAERRPRMKSTLTPTRDAPLPPTDRPASPVKEKLQQKIKLTQESVDKILTNVLNKTSSTATPKEVRMVKYALTQAQRESVTAKDKGEREWTPDDVYNRAVAITTLILEQATTLINELNKQKSEATPEDLRGIAIDALVQASVNATNQDLLVWSGPAVFEKAVELAKSELTAFNRRAREVARMEATAKEKPYIPETETKIPIGKPATPPRPGEPLFGTPEALAARQRAEGQVPIMDTLEKEEAAKIEAIRLANLKRQVPTTATPAGKPLIPSDQGRQLPPKVKSKLVVPAETPYIKPTPTELKTEGPAIGFPNSYNPYSTTPVAAGGGGSRDPNSLYHHKYMKYKSKYLNLKS